MSEEVRVYSTPACPYCKMAKEFLSKKGVEFADYDVKSDKEALKEMKRISGGALRVPVISVCNEVEDGNFLEYEPLRRGALWGIRRLAQVYPEMLIELDAVEYIRPYLEADDESSRELSAQALRMLRMERPVF